MLILVVVVGLLTYVETKVVRFGAGLPISNTVVMFILININTLVLLLLIFLVFRNVVKLLYDRKRKVMGAKLRTKLVVAFAGLSLIPTILLIFFSIQFITSSVEFWFNVPVEHALQRSLDVGKYVYKHVVENNRFYLERIAYQIARRDLLNKENRKALTRYIQVAQRAFNIQAIEVYSTHSERLALALEELAEWAAAHANQDLVAAADAWADRAYVLMGDAVACGLPAQELFEEVHRSNMTKQFGIRTGVGKAYRGTQYEPPGIDARPSR